MKRLLLLRHAHAGSASPGAGDIDRPLSERGRAEAREVGERLAALELRPELVLHSNAARAVETAEIALASIDPGIPAQACAALYLASPHALLATLGDHAGPATTVLVVAHNPGLGDLAQTLAWEGDTAALRALEHGFPTASLAWYAFEIDDWSHVHGGTGRLLGYARPGDSAGS